MWHLVLGLCVLAGLVACGGPSATPPPAPAPPGRATEPTRPPAASAPANPYLAREGEAPVAVMVGTCATTGAFVHLYTALEANLFAKYGLAAEHVFIGGMPSLGALGTNEIQFLYCGADSTVPGLAAGSPGKLVATTLKDAG